MARTITSANSKFSLIIPGLFDAPQLLQGYATDDAFTADDVDTAQVEVGVDGLMSAGYTPFITPMSVTFQANSISIDLFEQWLEAEKVIREKLPANGSILVRSVGKQYTLTTGVLTKVPQIVKAKKVLGPRTFGITWQNITPSPV